MGGAQSTNNNNNNNNERRTITLGAFMRYAHHELMMQRIMIRNIHALVMYDFARRYPETSLSDIKFETVKKDNERER